tara:strand:- start:1051 stop:2328 length:1278 start_codon:yes stop_codon:yes gene_type:complete
MFMLNVGYKWNWASNLDDLRGVIYLASGNDYARMSRKRIPEYSRSLFDPQLYLSELDVSRCSKACARLASFSWFGVPDVPQFDSGEINRNQWNAQLREHVIDHWEDSIPTEDTDIYNACLDCIEFQLDLSCSHIILPSPLMTERENEAEFSAQWLDQSIAAANAWDVGQPILATVAIHESTLNDQAFETNGFLDTVVDQITSRTGIDGVYIVIMQAQAAHPFETMSNVNQAYLYLSNTFAQYYDTVIVNFADIFGAVCLASSATSIATGQSYATRRLCMDFLDTTGGKALPHFYSHPALWEPFTERDLDVCVSRKCVSRIRDVTRVSRPLMDELNRGGSASNLPAWAEQQSNLSASTQHFLIRLRTEIDNLSNLSITERIEHVNDWLGSAIARQAIVKRRFGQANVNGKMAPADIWLDLFNDLIE